MDKRKGISAILELAVYATAAWLTANPGELDLLKPRMLLLSAKACRFAASQTASAAYSLGNLGIRAEKAYRAAMDAARP